MDEMDRYDIVAGIPSYNEADTITHVAEALGEGLKEYFPDRRSIIVNVDNNSADNTKGAFLSSDTPVDKHYISTEEGVNGKGNNLFNLFRFALSVDAEAVFIVDADLRSITKEWVEYLVMPVFKGYDFVTPVYARHQFDGTLTNHICYPVVFGLLSMDIRQPIGGEFAFSKRLIRDLLEKKWRASVRHYGIDIFMTLHAILGGFKICQTGLGTKVHKASAPKLGIMFEQVVETLFATLVEHRSLWIAKGIEDKVLPESFGLNRLTEPQEITIDVRDMKRRCRASFLEHLPCIKEVLDSYAFNRIQEMLDMDYYDLDILLWTQIFYNFLFRYDIAAGERERKRIINALKPLYLARSLSFDYSTWKYNIKYVETEVRNQALVFSSQKYYLWGLYARKNNIIKGL